MIRVLLTIFIGAAILSCAGHQVFQVPTDVPIPIGWDELTNAALDNGKCPSIAGKYTEPPARFSSPGSQFLNTEISRFSYFGALSINVANRKVLDRLNFKLSKGEFELTQVSENGFILRHLNLNNELVEYYFNKEQDDFECHKGLVYFSLITRFGADQHRSFNVQHQRILGVDVEGNLILIRITGPYKKTFFTRTANFEYDYMRYQRVE